MNSRWRYAPALAAVALAVLVVALVQQSYEETITTYEEAVGVAVGFLEARVDWDVEGAMSYLGPDALISVPPARTVADIPAEMAFLEATGWRYRVDQCAARNRTPEGHVRVLCSVTHENSWSRAAGLDPDTSSRFTVFVDDDAIVSVFLSFAPTTFENQAYTMFREWLTGNHPDDAERMLLYGTVPALTEESIELWAHYTREFVAGQDDS